MIAGILEGGFRQLIASTPGRYVVVLVSALVRLCRLDAEAGGWQQLTMLGWALAITSIPFFNREHLRAGDLIGGTQVISMPKRVLLGDLVAARPVRESYTFHHEQLAIYGAFELQVLEEFLRRPPLPENERLLEEVCGKICRKIGWRDARSPRRTSAAS